MPRGRVVAMKLWQSLYAMIWVALFEFMLVINPWRSDLLVYAHIGLGVVIIGLAYYNARELRETRVPGRAKRVAKATLTLAVLMAVLGVIMFGLLYLDLRNAWTIPLIDLSVYDIFAFLHFINGVAIITQAAAVAIVYDMWEDREFLKETEPGEVPANPMAKTSTPAAKR